MPVATTHKIRVEIEYTVDGSGASFADAVRCAEEKIAPALAVASAPYGVTHVREARLVGICSEGTWSP